MLRQANLSVSAAGVVRGIHRTQWPLTIHFADVPPGQAKYVTCAKGAVLDVAVDIRVGSPTFGRWDAVLLDDVDRHAIYISEGLGHAFMSLEDGSTVMYLCSTEYAPGREPGINPLDPDMGIEWPTTGRDGSLLGPTLSDKDEAAPSFAAARGQGPPCVRRRGGAQPVAARLRTATSPDAASPRTLHGEGATTLGPETACAGAEPTL